jgi:hypothetical protein
MPAIAFLNAWMKANEPINPATASVVVVYSLTAHDLPGGIV